jgi:hypothetical protein
MLGEVCDAPADWRTGVGGFSQARGVAWCQVRSVTAPRRADTVGFLVAAEAPTPTTLALAQPIPGRRPAACEGIDPTTN